MATPSLKTTTVCLWAGFAGIAGCSAQISEPVHARFVEIPAPAWTGAGQPAAQVLAHLDQPLVCENGETRFTWRADHTFEAVTRGAKYGGDWRLVDDAVVYLTHGPIGEPRCSQARFVPHGEGRVLLCAEGVWSCGAEASWVVEVISAGDLPQAAELVGGALSGPQGLASSWGPGVLLRGPDTALPVADPLGSDIPRASADLVPVVPRSAGIDVRYRPAGTRGERRDQAAALAQQIRSLLYTGPVVVESHRDAPSPLTVYVRGPVAPVVTLERRRQ